MIGGPSQSIGIAQQRNHEVARIPAPVEGMDIRQAIGSENLQHCVYTYNLSPFEYGLRVREGFREWAIDADNGSGLGVHTLVPFDSSDSLGAGDKLFAVTNEGIWDVTVMGSAPVIKVVFADQSVTSGFGPYAHYVNDAGTDILYYADSGNGLFSYTPSTNTWQQATGINGPTIANIKFIIAFKQRIWLVEKNSTKAWYLANGSHSGQATEFYFGSKFKHGRTLEGLFNWTVDGGAGLDDNLVAVSRAGDVLVYQGDDPTATNWQLRGVYYIGELPATPRFGSEHGGELFLLSAYGVSSLNDILQGVDSNLLRANTPDSSIAYKIAGLLRERMKTSRNDVGWGISLVPSEGGLLISVPQYGTEKHIQFYYNFATQAWGLWRGVPMLCFTDYGDSVYFGTEDNRVCRMDVSVDEQKITPLNPPVNGVDIEFSILTAFTSLGSPAVYKRPRLIRPDFIANQPPTHSSVIRYDFDINEGTNFQLSTPVGVVQGLWDVGSWEAAIWGSDSPTTFPSIGGAWGYGRYLAVATVGRSKTATRLIGWDLIYDIGGPMV